jgi:hypothetical protein
MYMGFAVTMGVRIRGTVWQLLRLTTLCFNLTVNTILCIQIKALLVPGQRRISNPHVFMSMLVIILVQRKFIRIA